MAVHATALPPLSPHFPPQSAKQAPVNNMNNAVLLKSPAEARQPA